MRYYTHLAFSFLVGIYLINFLQIKNQILFLMVFLFFSIFPDIDTIKSKISKKLRVFAYIVNFLLGHRGLVHSIWIPALIYLLLFTISVKLAIAASFGYLSHLVLDCFTVKGLRVLWPYKKRIKGFVKTGSIYEYILFIGLLIADIYFLINI